MLEKSDKKHNFVAFIPSRLYIPDKPSFAYFPLNILIGRYILRDGKKVFANVLYEPNLDSFNENDKEKSMIYHSPYDSRSFIRITINGEEYKVAKFFKNKEVSSSFGEVKGVDDSRGWQLLFIHVSFIGFKTEEIVMYEQIEK